MAPWPGRLRDNRFAFGDSVHTLPATYAGWAMHGTVLARPWTVDDATHEHLVLSIELGPSWPWPGRARLTWRLDGDSLVSELSVESDEVAFPAELGWHPWFRRRLGRGSDLTWSLDATAVLERGPDHLPTGRRLDPRAVTGPFDDAFEVPSGQVTLRWPGALRLSCVSDARWIVVFDELEDFVCVEPQTAPPDALGPGAGRARPGDPRRACATWTWASDAMD